MPKTVVSLLLLLPLTLVVQQKSPNTRPRAPELGLKIGVLPPGLLDAITDVAGVAVGHKTIIRGDNIRTGVTAILPHARNLLGLIADLIRG
jgi:D-aminopeptidase